MVAIASVFLLQILYYSSVRVKWKEKLIFAAINIRVCFFFFKQRLKFHDASHMLHHLGTCLTLLKKQRAAVLLNILIFSATVARTVVDFKLRSRGSESQPRSCRAGWIFPFKACSCPQMALHCTGWQQQVRECRVMPWRRITE